MGGQGSGRPKNPPKARELLKDVIPVNDLFEEDELKIYESLIDIYLKDFDEEELTAGDMDDIMGLAMNRVFEIRLLKTSKGNTNAQIDIATAIEKIRKESQKLKENLSSRRRDRINPNELKGFSIVDLAVAFDNEKKLRLSEKARGLLVEEQEAIERRGDYSGNRYDVEGVKEGEQYGTEEDSD
jgi:hypothetical protein